MASTETLTHPGEIPVTVHASRTTQGERVHEETRTVVTLPDGAVVRLKANLPPGELVVLTNGETKSHVICRVKNVKRSPERKEFVNLEFIKPAPEFWNGAVPQEEAPAQDAAAPAEEHSDVAPASDAPQHAPALTPALAPALETPQKDAEELPGRAPQSPVSGRRKPLWQQGGDVRDFTGPMAAGFDPSPAATSASKAAAEPAAISVSQLPANAPTTAAATTGLFSSYPGSLDDDDDDAGSGSRLSGLKTGVLAIVAVASITNGALLGAWVHKQMTKTSAAPQELVQQQAISLPVAVPVLPPAGGGSGAAAGSATATAASLRTVNGASGSGARETLPNTSPSIEERAPARRSETASAPVPAVSPIVIGKLQAPVRKNAPVTVDTVTPPVLPVANPGPGAVTAGIGLLADPGKGPAPPVPPVGGKLVPGQLISSPPPTYPPNARAQGIEGVVTLEALVDATGTVVETKVLFGHPLLQDAARATLLGWKYQPARLNGQAIPMRTKVSLRFSLH